MGPKELLGDGALRYVAEIFEEWPPLQVGIHAVAEAVVAAPEQRVLVEAERVLDSASALLITGERHKAHLLGESEGAE